MNGSLKKYNKMAWKKLCGSNELINGAEWRAMGALTLYDYTVSCDKMLWEKARFQLNLFIKALWKNFFV